MTPAAIFLCEIVPHFDFRLQKREDGSGLRDQRTRIEAYNRNLQSILTSPRFAPPAE